MECGTWECKYQSELKLLLGMVYSTAERKESAFTQSHAGLCHVPQTVSDLFYQQTYLALSSSTLSTKSLTIHTSLRSGEANVAHNYLCNCCNCPHLAFVLERTKKYL